MIAWGEIGVIHTNVYEPLNVLSFFFLRWGWFPRVTKFWIRHVISNMSIAIYLWSMTSLMAAIVTDHTIGSWVSFLGYGAVGLYFLNIEMNLGTDAIRAVDPTYFKDELLLPSILYLLRIVKHKTESETTDEFDFESDPSMADDIPIEEFHAVISL